MVGLNGMSIKFRKSDFEELCYNCVFINQTSGSDFRNYNKVKVEEFLDKGVRLIIPTNTCNISHSLMILFFEGNRPKIPKQLPKQGEGKGVYYSAIGKVVDKYIIEGKPEFSTITLNFIQFDKYGWQDLLDQYRDKQEEVTSTFNRIQINEE